MSEPIETRMDSRVLSTARWIAWAVALGAVCSVAIGYDSLPAELPVTRWTMAPKSLFVALRVPLINLLSLGLIEVMSRGIRRLKDFWRADAFLAALLLTVAAKAGIEAAGILMLPVPFTWTMVPLVIVLGLGLCAAAFLGKDLLRSERWQKLQLTRLETAAALALVSGIVVLNLPLFSR